ncbi:MAG TPA: c-type cytochrome [Rhodocyclaceae bacterium]|nr:c-type cytochrome [Rhodocyclaceae bacterium]
MKNAKFACLPMVLAFGLSVLPGQSFAQVDDAAVKSLLKRNDCTKCHAIDKTKKGPAYKKVAEKLRSKPRAEAEKIVIDNITKSPKVKLEDGTEEEHKVIDTKDPKDFKMLVDWLLAL